MEAEYKGNFPKGNRRRLLRTLIPCIAAGGLLVAIVELPGMPRGVRDVGLVLGGALIGLFSLIIDEILRAGPERRAAEEQLDSLQRDFAEQAERDARLRHAAADNGFTLGYEASRLPIEVTPEGWAVLWECCDNLGLQFGAEESKLLAAPPEDFVRAREVSEMLLSKGRNLGPPLGCFLQLGNTLVWLEGRLDHWHQTRAVLTRLEKLAANSFLQDDPQFASIVYALIEALTPYRDGVSKGDSSRLSEDVRKVLSRIPAFTRNDFDLRIADQGSEWLWANDARGNLHPVRFLGPYRVSQRDPDLFEVSNEHAGETLVSHDAEGWHCQAHPEASETEPCEEIEVVLDATDGGQPVTEARLLLVRTEEETPPASEASS